MPQIFAQHRTSSSVLHLESAFRHVADDLAWRDAIGNRGGVIAHQGGTVFVSIPDSSEGRQHRAEITSQCAGENCGFRPADLKDQKPATGLERAMHLPEKGPQA